MNEVDYFKEKHTDKELTERYSKYANDVLTGKITACRYIILACKRFYSFFKNKNYYFDAQNVYRVEKFISNLKLSTGKFGNQPFLLEEWEKFALANIFGWKWKNTNLRVTKSVSLCVSRKNGKTSFFAAILLYCLIADGENEASCLLAANSAAQAQICFTMCSNLLASIDPKGKYFKRYRDNIRFGKNKLKVCPAVAERLDGENASVFIEDECHAAPNSSVYDVLISSQGMREQPLGLVCSTRGFNLSSWYYSWDSQMIEILEGLKKDDSTFPLIYTLDEGDDYHDESVWIKANPNLGVTVTKDYLKEMIQRSDNDPIQQTNVKTKLFNMWCASSEIWIPMQTVVKSFKTVNLKDYEGCYCNVGVDLAAVSDLTAVSVLIQNEEKKIFKNYYFLPSECLKRSNPNWDLWRNAKNIGDLIITDGNVTDYDAVLKLLQQIQEICSIQKISYDQWNSTQFILDCQEQNLPMKPFSQAIASMNRPTKELERQILSDNVIIDKNIITKFCFQNALPKTDFNDNIKIIKESYQQKIDGVVAMIMALGGVLEEIGYDNSIDGIDFK